MYRQELFPDLGCSHPLTAAAAASIIPLRVVQHLRDGHTSKFGVHLSDCRVLVNYIDVFERFLTKNSQRKL